VFAAAALMLLFYYSGAPRVDYALTVNGEEVHGLRGVAFATGGLLVAGLAAAGALALVALVLAGTSMILLGVMAAFFLVLLFAFSPVLAPVVGIALVIALVARRRKGKSPHDAALR
jgi:hypothetical protein